MPPLGRAGNWKHCPIVPTPCRGWSLAWGGGLHGPSVWWRVWQCDCRPFFIGAQWKWWGKWETMTYEKRKKHLFNENQVFAKRTRLFSVTLQFCRSTASLVDIVDNGCQLFRQLRTSWNWDAGQPKKSVLHLNTQVSYLWIFTEGCQSTVQNPQFGDQSEKPRDTKSHSGCECQHSSDCSRGKEHRHDQASPLPEHVAWGNMKVQHRR